MFNILFSYKDFCSKYQTGDLLKMLTTLLFFYG